ncbi:hypothetical protein AMTRI_Chr02g265710 [Amborella trichopoda]
MTLLSDFHSHPFLEVGPPTENNSGPFLSTGNPCLDFFFHIVPDTPPQKLTHLHSLAWHHDSLTTLKLIPAMEIRIGKFGFLKDLLEILFLLIEGHDARKLRREEHNSSKAKPKAKPKPEAKAKARDVRVEQQLAKGQVLKAEAREEREKRRLNYARRALERYYSDRDYRYLHDKVSETFAELLASDLKPETKNLSFAAKWCPSLGSSYDQITLICESIAKRLFPINSYPEYKVLEETHYAYRVRIRMSKEVLVPLRRALELPEVYMSSNKWISLPYDRVASGAMKNYKKHFKWHDRRRFRKFLKEVEKGEKKIAAGALLPHEILASGQDQKHGKLSNCLAVCDVSGSMRGLPMEVCVALGLLVSDLSAKPWKGTVITFSNEPQIHKIQGKTIFERRKFVVKRGRLRKEKMIKRLFVFSDMEFDKASKGEWETDYMAIERKFRRRGYGKPPQIVFWNLRDSEAIPNLLKCFMDNGGEINAEGIMEDALSAPPYVKLVVVD